MDRVNLSDAKAHRSELVDRAEAGETVEQGAATTVLLAASRLLDGVSGRYFEDCNEAKRVERRPTDFTGGIAAYALDPVIPISS